jgi:hypothetical protein
MVQAYEAIKRLATGFGYRRFACVGTGDATTASDCAAPARLAAAAGRFLGVQVAVAGQLADGTAAPALLRRTGLIPAAVPA